MHFRTKTAVIKLAVGQTVDVQIDKSNQARIYDNDRSDKVLSIMFMATALLAFFVVKSCDFLLTLFG